MTRARLRFLRGALALGVVLGASGCWLQPDADAGHSRSNPFESTLTAATVSGLTRQWSTPLDTVSSGPVVSGGRAYATYQVDGVPAPGPRLAALRTDTGAVAWDADLATGAPNEAHRGVTFSGDELWVPNRFVYAPDCPLPMARLSPAGDRLADGEPVSFMSDPVTSGDTVAYTELVFGAPPACASVGTRLTVRDRETFALRYTVEGGEFPTDAPTAPAVAGDTVVVGVGDRVLALPAGGCGATTCEPLWTVSLASGTPGVDREVTGTPVVAGGRVFVQEVSYESGPATTTVRAYDLDDGAALWAWPARFVTGLAVAGDTVFVVASVVEGAGPSPSLLVALPAACGPCAGQWRVPIGDDTGAGGPIGAPTVGGDVVYVPTGAPRLGGVDGQVLAFDADGCASSPCTPLAAVAVPGTPGGMAVSGGQVIVSSTVRGGTGQGGAVTAFGLP